MPLARLRRALTSSSTSSSQSAISSTTTSSSPSTLDFSITTSTPPREISYFDLPLLSRSPTTRNPSPRDVFPSSPQEAGFTNSAFPSPPSLETPVTPVTPSTPGFTKQEIKHKRTSSRTSMLMRMLRRERPHPAERLLKPADAQTVRVLECWGGFESRNMMKTGRRDRETWEGVGPLDDF